MESEEKEIDRADETMKRVAKLIHSALASNGCQLMHISHGIGMCIRYEGRIWALTDLYKQIGVNNIPHTLLI